MTTVAAILVGDLAPTYPKPKANAVTTPIAVAMLLQLPEAMTPQEAIVELRELLLVTAYLAREIVLGVVAIVPSAVRSTTNIPATAIIDMTATTA
jgi:hypothetical protein